MAFCIEKFSAWFCLIVSTEEESFKRNFESFCPLPSDMELFDYITGKLEWMYAQEFGSALEKTFDFEKYCCFKDYMEAIISKCLELSTPRSYLRFLLICAFIRRIISERTSRRKKCFVFAKMVSQCLIELYNGRYNYLFEDKDHIETFEIFCAHLSNIFKKRMPISVYREIEPFNQQDVIDLMNNLNCRRKSPGLNCCVQEILRPTVLAVFPKYFSMEAEESASTSEYEAPIKEESSINESEVEFRKEESDIKESKSDETLSREEFDVNDSEYDETSSQKESDTDVSESDETSSNKESDINDSESDEISNKESDINESESDETSSKKESDINESESDETSSKKEYIRKEFESGETYAKAESNISESESNETFSKESCINESTRSLNEDEEDSVDPHKVCEYCNMKCFQFVSSFLAKEFVEF